MKILFVDDEPDILEQSRIFLSKEDGRLEIETSTSAEEALNLLNKEEYDAIVSDYQMPEIDGLDFLRIVRGERESDIPFIIFTGKGREEVAMEALNLGADRYLQKGGDPKSQYGVLAQAIVQEVNHWISERRARELEALRSTVRNINQILTKSRSIENASKEICETLLENKGYLDISINLQENSIIRPIASCGSHEMKEWELRLVEDQELELQEGPECFKKVLDSNEELIIERKEKSDYCQKCKYCLYDKDHASVKIPINLDDRKIILSLCLRIGRLDDDELKLIRELAYDIQQGFKRMEIEEKLNESEEKYRTLFNQSINGIYLHDINGRILDVNEKACKQSGYAREELLKMTVFDLHPNEKDTMNMSKNKILRQWSEWGLEESHSIRAEHQRKDGTIYPVQVSAGIVRYNDKNRIIAIVQDITERNKFEDELREKHRQLETLFSSLPGMAFRCLTNENWTIKLVSEGCKEIFGYDPEELIDDKVISWRELIHPEDRENVRDEVMTSINKREPYQITYRIRTSEGEEKWVWEKGNAIYDENGKVKFLEGFTQDITERKKAEKELQKRKEGLKERLKELKCLYDISKLFEESGNSLEHILQKSVELIPPSWQYPEITCARLTLDDEEFKTENYEESEWELKSDILVDGEKRGSLEVLYLEERPENDKGPFLKEERHLIEAITKQLSKIIKQFELEKKIRKKEEKYRVMTEGSKNGIYLFQDGKFKFVNDTFLKSIGYTREELEKTNYLDLVHPDYREKLKKCTEKALKGDISGLPEKHEFRVMRKDGSQIWVKLTPSIIEYQGKPAIIGNVTDITERKEIEEKYAFESNLLNSLLDKTNDLVYFKDENARYTRVSEKYAEIMNIEKSEILGKTAIEIYQENGREMYKDDLKVLKKGEKIINKQHKITLPNGEIRWISTQKLPQYDDKGNIIGIIGASRDVTKRKEMEEDLRDALSRQEVLFNQLSEAIFLEDMNGQILEVNNMTCRLLGYDREELLQMNARELVPKDSHFIKPEELDEKTQKYQTIEGINLHKNGTRIPVEVKGRIIELEGEKRLLISLRDITERKKTQEREEFLHSILRHDIRNKTSIAHGYFELLKDENLSEEGREYLENTMRVCSEVTGLIEKINTLLKIDNRENITEVNINSIINNLIRESKPHATEKGIKINYEDLDCKVLGGSLLKELFSNLIENAIIHSNCSEIRISGQNKNGECIIKVEDDGIGIPDKHKEKIFKRGYKTGGTSGSGLGTYIAKKIAEEYNGNIEVKDSELGGARFDIRLDKA